MTRFIRITIQYIQALNLLGRDKDKLQVEHNLLSEGSSISMSSHSGLLQRRSSPWQVNRIFLFVAILFGIESLQGFLSYIWTDMA